MPGRPEDDSAESQQIKYNYHKLANGTLNHYIDTNNFIAAYVVAFSLLEDRLRSMYVVAHRHLNSSDPIKGDIEASFSKLTSYLDKHKYLDHEICKQLHKVSFQRNKLLHEAMWRLDTFRMEDIKHVISLRNKVRTELEKLKRSIKQQQQPETP